MSVDLYLVAKKKWVNLQNTITTNNISLDKTDWNILYCLCDTCNHNPADAIKWLNKLENKYLEPFSDQIKERVQTLPINVPCKAPNGISIDPCASGSRN